MTNTASISAVPPTEHISFVKKAKESLGDILERGLRIHPVLTVAATLVAVGVGMVAAVALAAACIVLPLSLAAGLL